MNRGWSTAKQASVLPLIPFYLGGGGEEHWLFLLCSYTSTLLEAITFLWLGFAKENRIKHFSSAFLTHSSSYRTLPEKPVFSANSSSPSHPSAGADTGQRHQHGFARSELCLCRLYNALTQKKSFKKGKKKPRRKKLTTLLPHVMDSKPWLTCQFKCMKKPQGRKCWEIFFSLISQNEGPTCLLEFFIWLHVLLMCLSPADKPPWPLHFPRAQSRGDTPRPQVGHCPLTVILPLCFLQDI